jgi:hypothetical protein
MVPCSCACHKGVECRWRDFSLAKWQDDTDGVAGNKAMVLLLFGILDILLFQSFAGLWLNASNCLSRGL